MRLPSAALSVESAPRACAPNAPSLLIAFAGARFMHDRISWAEYEMRNRAIAASADVQFLEGYVKLQNHVTSYEDFVKALKGPAPPRTRSWENAASTRTHLMRRRRAALTQKPPPSPPCPRLPAAASASGTPADPVGVAECLHKYYTLSNRLEGGSEKVDDLLRTVLFVLFGNFFMPDEEIAVLTIMRTLVEKQIDESARSAPWPWVASALELVLSCLSWLNVPDHRITWCNTLLPPQMDGSRN